MVAEEKNALRLFSLTEGALATGLHQGMPLTDAKGVLPDLLTQVREERSEADLLITLHRWAERYSPWRAMEGHDALLLDITGCSHLWGGEAPMAEDIAQALEGFGFRTHLAVADSKGAALTAARFTDEALTLIPPGRSTQVLGALPLTALGDKAYDLRRLGLKTLADVAALPRAEMAKRFGYDLMLRLDETLGTRSTPVSPTKAARPYAARMSFPDPIGLLSDVTMGLEKVLGSLCRQLREDGRGARLVELSLNHADGEETVRQVGLAEPCQNPNLILRQFTPLLEKVDAGFGIDRMRVIAITHEGYTERQLSSETEQVGSDKLTELVGRLGNRLGFDRIAMPRPTGSHLPGFDVRQAEAVSRPETSSWPPSSAPLPLRLTPPRPVEPLSAGRPPGRFRCQDTVHEITHARGPRRVAGEWWQNDRARHPTYDYWDVQTRDGARLWLRCDVNPQGERRWMATGELP